MNAFAYVKDAYSVPAHRGARVWWHGVEGRMIHATAHVRLRFNAADVPAGHRLERYVHPKRPTFVLTLHPCESGIAYDRETPDRHKPDGWGYFVWSELCYRFGIKHQSDEAYRPSLREPWPRLEVAS